MVMDGAGWWWVVLDGDGWWWMVVLDGGGWWWCWVLVVVVVGLCTIMTRNDYFLILDGERLFCDEQTNTRDGDFLTMNDDEDFLTMNDYFLTLEQSFIFFNEGRWRTIGT